MKILEKQTSDALKKQLKKMCKRNRRIYLKNLKEDSLNNIWIDYGNIPSAMYPQNKSNKCHQIGKCEPLPNLSKIEGTFE